VRVFPGVSCAQALAGIGRRFFAGHPEAGVWFAGLGVLYLGVDLERDSFIVALDTRSGEELWRRSRTLLI
jgi:hypothetical protein